MQVNCPVESKSPSANGKIVNIFFLFPIKELALNSVSKGVIKCIGKKNYEKL